MKEFIGEYGLIIVTAMVIVAFIALTSGFGTQIGDAITDEIDTLIEYGLKAPVN